jgi:hypothetical protein
MTETEQQTTPVETEGDGESTATGELYLSMNVSIDQPGTARRGTTATVLDVDDLADEILTAAAGLAQMAGVGNDFRKLVSQHVHVVQISHEAHPDEVTAAAERAVELARLLAERGFSATEPTDDFRPVIVRILDQRDRKTTLIAAVERELAPALRESDPDGVAEAVGVVAQRLMDYRTNLAKVLDPDVEPGSDDELLRQAVLKLGVLGDVNGDLVGFARAAYADATLGLGKVETFIERDGPDAVSVHDLRPMLDAVKALGALLDMRVLEPQPDPVAARD